MSNRPPNEWSAGAVVYWVEHVFGRERKLSQISEFVTELKLRCSRGDVTVAGTGLAQFSPNESVSRAQTHRPAND